MGGQILGPRTSKLASKNMKYCLNRVGMAPFRLIFNMVKAIGPRMLVIGPKGPKTKTTKIKFFRILGVWGAGGISLTPDQPPAAAYYILVSDQIPCGSYSQIRYPQLWFFSIHGFVAAEALQGWRSQLRLL